MESKEITKFLEEQTEKIKPIYIKMGHSYWNATTTGKKEFYKKFENFQKEMAKFFNNKENFEKIKEFLKLNIEDDIIKRQLIIIYNFYLSHQGDIDLINKILEKSILIEEKFNKFRAKINEKEFTDNQIKSILENEIDSIKLQEAWEASKKQGELVSEELIELVKLRNQLAKSLGFKNYYVFSLETNEQKEEDIAKIFEKLKNLTDSPFEKIKSNIDNFLRERYGVQDLKPWHYQDLFFQESPKINMINLSKFYEKDILEKARKFYQSIGFNVSDILERSDLYEKSGKNQHAYCIDLDREGDIRSLMNIKNDEKWMETVLHELGHGVYWKYIDQNLPFLLKDASHTLTTEAIAQLFGRNSKNISFIKKFGDNSSENLDVLEKEIGNSLQIRQLIFSRWSQVMLHFEKNLYENPDQDLNKLWWDLVKKYQLIDFSRNKADWASKIHLVSSPVYYHNYILGELFASQINNQIAKKVLKKDSSKNMNYNYNKEIGEYLKLNIFYPGASYRWDELIKNSTNEELNPKYWVNQFC